MSEEAEARRLLDQLTPYTADTQAARRQFVIDRVVEARGLLEACDADDPDRLVELVCDAQCILGKAVIEIMKASLE